MQIKGRTGFNIWRKKCCFIEKVMRLKCLLGLNEFHQKAIIQCLLVRKTKHIYSFFFFFFFKQIWYIINSHVPLIIVLVKCIGHLCWSLPTMRGQNITKVTATSCSLWLSLAVATSCHLLVSSLTKQLLSLSYLLVTHTNVYDTNIKAVISSQSIDMVSSLLWMF